MGKIMYRWYYKEDGKATISGVVLNDERFITTLWVWEADTDDDYNDDCPDCLAVAY